MSPSTSRDGRPEGTPGAYGYAVDEEERKGVVKVAKEYLASHAAEHARPANPLRVEAFEKTYPKKEAALQ